MWGVFKVEKNSRKSSFIKRIREQENKEENKLSDFVFLVLAMIRVVSPLLITNH